MTDMDFVAEYLCVRRHKQVRAIYAKLLTFVPYTGSKLHRFMSMKDSDTIETMIIRWSV